MDGEGLPACSGRPLLDFRLLNQEINLYMCASGYLKRPSVTLKHIGITVNNETFEGRNYPQASQQSEYISM